MATWMRRYLRMSGAETRRRRRAAIALVELPAVRAAVEAVRATGCGARGPRPRGDGGSPPPAEQRRPQGDGGDLDVPEFLRT